MAPYVQSHDQERKNVVHAIKFQFVVLPNGLIENWYGPVGKPLAVRSLAADGWCCQNKNEKKKEGRNENMNRLPHITIHNNWTLLNNKITVSFYFLFQREETRLTHDRGFGTSAGLTEVCLFSWSSAALCYLYFLFITIHVSQRLRLVGWEEQKYACLCHILATYVAVYSCKVNHNNAYYMNYPSKGGEVPAKALNEPGIEGQFHPMPLKDTELYDIYQIS